MGRLRRRASIISPPSWLFVAWRGAHQNIFCPTFSHGMVWIQDCDLSSLSPSRIVLIATKKQCLYHIIVVDCSTTTLMMMMPRQEQQRRLLLLALLLPARGAAFLAPMRTTSRHSSGALLVPTPAVSGYGGTCGRQGAQVVEEEEYRSHCSKRTVTTTMTPRKKTVTTT